MVKNNVKVANKFELRDIRIDLCYNYFSEKVIKKIGMQP